MAPTADGHREIPYAGLIDLLNPVEALAAATADGIEAQYLGEEKFEDSAVEHFRVTTDAERYAAAQVQLGQARRDGLRAALAPGGSVSLTLDLWLNDKDQLVRLQRTGTGASGRADDAVLYSDFAGDPLGAGPGRGGHRGRGHPKHLPAGPLRAPGGRFAPDGRVRLVLPKPKTAGCRRALARGAGTEGSAIRRRQPAQDCLELGLPGPACSHVDPSRSN